MNNFHNESPRKNSEATEKEIEKEKIREIIRQGSNKANNTGKEYSKVNLKDIALFILFVLVSGVILYFTSIVLGIVLIGIIYLISKIFVK